MKDDFKPLVSCILPIYNAEKYLDQGVGSLLAQTYENLEIILVDDWSSDDSWALCQQFATTHENVFAVRTKNGLSGGPLRGRERGIREARGEWITFMDGDDYVAPTYIEHLVEATDNGKYDISVTGYARAYADGRIENFLWDNYSQSTEKRLKTSYEHFLDQNYYTDPTDTVGQNLIRASIVKATDLSKYPNKVWAEDTLMALAFLANSKNGVNFVDHHEFFWRQTSGSGSNGGFSSTADKPAFFRACYDIFNEKGLLPLVTVIIPVYNVEKYLGACVESVRTQTYPNLEIILVDDMSLDTSGKMADEYAKKDARIKVVHKPKNEGLNMARKSGFDVASGKYITFLDSDDLFHENSVAHSMRTLITNKADAVMYASKEFSNQDEKRGLTADAITLEEKAITSKKQIAEYAFFGEGNLAGIQHMTVWGKLYTRSAMEHVDWKAANYRVYEDSFWTPQVLLKANKIVLMSEQLMYYRRNVAYGKLGNNLGNRLTGNSVNGKPVGYLEYLDNLQKFYAKLALKYGFESKLDERMNWYMSVNKTWRIDNLVDAGLLDSENNLEYVVQALPEYIKAKNTHINNLDTTIAHLNESLEDVNQKVILLEGENAHLNQRIEEFMGLKRSVKLLLGNVKRKAKNLLR